MLAHYLTALQIFGFQLYAELEGYETTGMFFNSLKPDIVLIKNNSMIKKNCMYITELAIYFETNTCKSRQYKTTRYANIESETKRKYDKIVIILR